MCHVSCVTCLVTQSRTSLLIDWISVGGIGGRDISLEKSCIRETLNLLMCADTSTDTIFCIYFCRCQVSGVTCCMSPVTCHMSLTPTSTARDPPPANSPSMHSRMFLLPWPRPLNTESQRPTNHFWAKIANRGTNVLSLLCPKESFCNLLIWLLTFVHWSKRKSKNISQESQKAA